MNPTCNIYTELNWLNNRTRSVILFKGAFAVVPTDTICGRSLSSDHSGYCVINRMRNKNPR